MVRYWYFEVYNMLRRLALTSGSLVFDSVDSMLLYILAVAILTTVIERETQAELNPFLGAFVYVCCWQVVLVIIGECKAAGQVTKQRWLAILRPRQHRRTAVQATDWSGRRLTS